MEASDKSAAEMLKSRLNKLPIDRVLAELSE
jgi:hypothetical protein